MGIIGLSEKHGVRMIRLNKDVNAEQINDAILVNGFADSIVSDGENMYLVQTPKMEENNSPIIDFLPAELRDETSDFFRHNGRFIQIVESESTVESAAMGFGGALGLFGLIGVGQTFASIGPEFTWKTAIASGLFLATGAVALKFAYDQNRWSDEAQAGNPKALALGTLVDGKEVDAIVDSFQALD